MYEIGALFRCEDLILLPVYKHQVVSQQSTFGLWPEDTYQAAGIQAFIHEKRVSQLVHGLQTGRKSTDVRNIYTKSL